MTLQCPHCHAPFEGALAEDRDARCSACGGRWQVVSLASTAPYPGDEHSTLDVPLSRTVTANPTRSIGHFELLSHVGSGTFGDVWRARDTALDRIVAVKTPRRADLSPEESDYFLREARAAAQLQHPNIVSVHEAGRRDETIYIVSDFVDGSSLKDRLARQRLTIREAVELTVKIAAALHHAHEAGIVHRDLKPGNIMIDARGEPRVMDFGLAKRESGEVTMTAEGRLLGTPAYMSPEQARGEGHSADRRADVYSLGVMLFELLTGERPFRGDAAMLIVQIQNDQPPGPRKLQSRLPRDLDTICLKCLEKDPARRFQAAKELADELRLWLEGKPVVSRPVGWAGRVWRLCLRRPMIASLTALCIALALAVMIGGPILYFKESIARDAESEARQLAEKREAEAIKARNDAKSSEAKQAFDAAGLAAERGRWSDTLKHLAAAEKAGFSDAFELGMLRVRALRSLAEFQKWSREITRLETLAGTKAERAQFLLVKGELLRFQGQRDGGLKLVAEAIQLELPASQMAYANGLMARTTPEAAKYFGEAVDADPTFHEASSSLVATLVLLGRLEEAKLRARVAIQLFPQDPTYPFWLALMAALEQDERQLEYWTLESGKQMKEQHAVFIKQSLRVIHTVIGSILRLEDANDKVRAQLLDAWRQIHGIQSAARRNSDDDTYLSTFVRSLLNAIPPAMSRPFTSLGDLGFVRLAIIAAGKDKEFNKALGELATVHPEATILWLYAAMLTEETQYEAASQMLERAANAPAMIPAIKPQAMYLAALASYVQFDKTKDRAAIRRSALLARRRVSMGNLSKEEADLMRDVAFAARDLDLAQSVVQNVLRQFPNDVTWRNWEAGVAFRRGELFRVLLLTRRIQQEFPNDKMTHTARAAAMRQIRSVVDELKYQFPVKARKPSKRR